MFELAFDVSKHGMPQFFWKVIGLGLLKDISFILQTGIIAFAIFFTIYIFHRRTARIFLIILSVLLLIIQVALSQYFTTTLVPLGADVWGYSWNDIKLTVGAAGIKISMILIFVAFIALTIAALIYIPRKIKVNNTWAFFLFTALILGIGFGVENRVNKLMPGQEYSNNLSINKSYFFYSATLDHFFPAKVNQDIYTDTYSGDFNSDEKTETNTIATHHYIDEQEYPFLHTIDSSADVLSPFFNKGATPPNIVIVLVEGLGRAFTNKGAYLGNFTPFIDSLAEKSLYWENFLSEGGRTFAVLPSFMGSLPFAKNGFNELGDRMPQHLSLLSLLKYNGYNTSFYYGGESQFDFMSTYMRKNNIDAINDEPTYPSGYTKMPASSSGFSWGYGDKELFRRYFETKQNPTQPFASVVLTVSTHSPFFVNE